MATTILLADDHPLLLNGTKEFLEKKNFKIIDIALDGLSAYNKILALQPDIAILDFDMPKLNGLEIAKEIKRNDLATKVIILTLYKEEAILKQIGKTVHAYITKDSALEELEICLGSLEKDTNYIGKNLRTQSLFGNTSDINFKKLTPTEVKILKYLDKNLTSNQIAEELFISKRTVEKHRANIIKKLEIDSTNQNALILWLIDNPNIFST